MDGYKGSGLRKEMGRGLKGGTKDNRRGGRVTSGRGTRGWRQGEREDKRSWRYYCRVG